MIKKKSFREHISELTADEKDEFRKILDEAAAAKYKKCIRKDGKFDYLKMLEMYHSGQW